MTNCASNILPFPIRHAPIRHAPIQAASQLMAAEAAIHNLQVRGNKDPIAAEEYREHVACIVGVAIRAGRRKGRSPSSLQPQLRKWLIELCEQGDPPAVMVHDWLTGNRRHLTHGFDREEAQRQRMPNHGADMGEGA
jgi:hypothetical protein